MIYLYKKTHNKTGLKYLGKTTQNPFKYRGSGMYWKRHIKEHGNDITTEILFETENKLEFKEVAIKYSKELNIVESKEWANFREETGDGGFSKEDRCVFTSETGSFAGRKGGKSLIERGLGFTLETASNAGSKGGKSNKGKPKSEAHKKAIKEALIKRNNARVA